MKKFDLVIVGGGIVTSYIIKRLKEKNLNIAIIDKFDFDSSSEKVESAYYDNILGYRNKNFGGLSEFWGGQIQDIDSENILSIVNKSGFNFSKLDLSCAKDKVLNLLNFKLNNSTLNKISDRIEYKRVLNTWLGQTRLVGREANSIINQKKITLIKGKTLKITQDKTTQLYMTEYLGEDIEASTLYSNKVFFCGGLLGLAEYLLDNNICKIVKFSDHYSVRIANISRFTAVGKLITPYFSNRKLITPRLYFNSLEFSNNISLYSTLPFQKELGEMREAKKNGIFSVILYILKRKNIFHFTFFILKMGYSLLFNKKIPLINNRLDINAFVDTSLMKDTTIQYEINRVLINTVNESDINNIKDKIYNKLIEERINKTDIIKAKEEYFECGYHAYCLMDETGSKASRFLTEMGVIVFGSSELNDIGDKNPVFSTLVLTELLINKFMSIE